VTRVLELRTADARLVCARCVIAADPWRRMKGLLGRSTLAPDEGLLLRPAGSIHMFFMRFPIDAVFCDRELRVLHVERDLQPGKMARQRGAKVVIELASGAAASIEPGMQLQLVDPTT